MKRDMLFLLPPGFIGREGAREYCPECAEMWGLLSYYPAIKESVDIIYQPIDKPREDIIARIGEANQNCPTLILAADSPIYEDCGVLMKNGHRFINNARDIGAYYARRFGTAYPRGR